MVQPNTDAVNPLLEEGDEDEDADQPSGDSNEDEAQDKPGEDGDSAEESPEVAQAKAQQALAQWRDQEVAAAVKEAGTKAAAAERARIADAQRTAQEQARLKEIESIQDPDERAERLAAFGEEELNRRRTTEAETAQRQKIMSAFWQAINAVIPEAGQLTGEEQAKIYAAAEKGATPEEQDALFTAAFLDVVLSKRSGVSLEQAANARAKEILDALANAETARKNRKGPPTLPGGSPSPGGASGDIKNPGSILSEAFAAIREEEKG